MREPKLPPILPPLAPGLQYLGLDVIGQLSLQCIDLLLFLGHYWTSLDALMAPKSGIEPETYRLGGGRSIH